MKKVVGCFVILLLFAGSICGIVFGCLYNSARDKLQPFLDEEQEYSTIINSFEKTVAEQALKIEELSLIIEALTQENTENKQDLEEISGQLSQAQTEIKQLSVDLEAKKQTILQYTELSAELSSEIFTLESSITALNNKISKLQENINYYEEYIASLENGDQAVVTFEFDGAVYDVQIVNKNSLVTVTTPTSTDHVIFNYWTVDGEQVDLSTYEITTNTKFVAAVTYKYDVKFMVDNQEISSQLIEEGQFATVPEFTEEEGYIFDGWSLDGVNIVENIESTPVTQNVTYQALYSKVFKVEFVYNEETISTQQIKSGELAKNVFFAVADNEIFNGWTVDEILVDIESYRITADTIFVASISHKFEVKFMVDDEVIDSQFVVENNFASLPEEPIKAGYKFFGWSLNDGGNLVDIDDYVIDGNTEFFAIFVVDITGSFNISFAGAGEENLDFDISYGDNNFVLNYNILDSSMDLDPDKNIEKKLTLTLNDEFNKFIYSYESTFINEGLYYLKLYFVFDYDNISRTWIFNLLESDMWIGIASFTHEELAEIIESIGLAIKRLSDS